MLCNLQIENIAVIKKAVIDFKNGFNVMTGETGAGKSIVIDSINAILGERTSRELIRSGAADAFVCAEFDSVPANVQAVLAELDFAADDDALVIQRKISADGKNSCRINGLPATVSMLKRIGRELVNIHGQLDNQALLSSEFHCGYIDQIAENCDLLSDYQSAYSLYLSKKKELAALYMDESEKSRKLDLLNYQIEEIEAAAIRPGEKDELQKQLDFLRNAEKIMGFLHLAYSALNGDGDFNGAVSAALSASAKLESASLLSDRFDSVSKGISEAAYNLSAYTDELRDLLADSDYDIREIDAIEERLDVLYKLMQKYGKTENDILVFLENAITERDQIVYADEYIEKLKQILENAKKEAMHRAELLSASRREAADRFSKHVAGELVFLDMPSVQFVIKHTVGDLTENGIDHIEFMLSANKGEAPKPLNKTASGGELSRIMLAIKSVLAEKDVIGTLIFDEIDAGVSGRAALKIAQKLKNLSKTHQVICVTHLAQIAAYGDAHLIIEKSEIDGRTFTQVHMLDYTGRKFEIARIMGGLVVTENILNSAEELLASAGILNNG